jgi:hypothetical protein
MYLWKSLTTEAAQHPGCQASELHLGSQDVGLQAGKIGCQVSLAAFCMKMKIMLL